MTLKELAVKQMEFYKICDTAIEDFKNNDIITIADNGVLRNLTVLEDRKVREMQKFLGNKYLIYHIIFSSNEEKGICFYLVMTNPKHIHTTCPTIFACVFEFGTLKKIARNTKPPFDIRYDHFSFKNINGVLYGDM